MKDRGHWIVICGIVIPGLFAGLSLYHTAKYSLIFYGDAVSHMVMTRRLVDWFNPGLQQLGTVWLPIPHLLFLPFTLVDSLFFTGLLGLVVSLPCLAVAAACLYRMTDRTSGPWSSAPAFAASALFALNPNILYIGLTPMTEAPFLASFLASAFFFERWRRNPENLRDLAWCSGFICLASLSRYEAWIIPGFLIPFTIARTWRAKQNFRYPFLVSLGSCLGIFAWLFYNWAQYGNMLEFANAQFYSAASQALERPFRESLMLQPVNVLSAYVSVAQDMYGTLALIVAGIGLFVLGFGNERSRIPGLIYLLLPPLFTLISLFFGIAEISEWFNARYLVLLGPAVAYLASVSLDTLRGRDPKHAGVLLAAAIVILFVPFVTTPLFGRIVTYAEAKSGFEYLWNPSAVETGIRLRSLYDHGTIVIMTGSAQEHRIMVTSGIPLRTFDELIESSTWKKSYYEPWSSGRWLVMSKHPDSDAVAVVDHWKRREDELNSHYAKAFENEYFVIFRLK